MITTLLQISWLNLKRDYVALALTFVLPVIFFSIFAAIFGGMGGGDNDSGGRPIRVVLVDEDKSEFSEKYMAEIAKQASLKVITSPSATTENPTPTPYSRESSATRVRKGRADVAVIIPAGLGASTGDMLGGGGQKVLLYYDPSNPIARHTVTGLLQASAMSAAPNLMMDKGLVMFEQFGGGFTEQQKEALAFAKQNMAADESSGGGGGLIQVEAVDARAGEADDTAVKAPSMVAYYAAGIGVMFLLFSMSAAGGSLLEEEESGTMDRLLTSNMGMGTLLVGKWLFFAILGIAQMVVMFVWGALVFGLDLFSVKHFSGFVLLTIPCGMGAAAFGILLATAAKTRAQLSGMSTIIILIMSALGGSMVPRFAMPAFMDTTAMFTFNGWAIDGYLKIFWREDPNHSLLESLVYILPEVGMLSLMTLVFLGLARRFAKRWETL